MLLKKKEIILWIQGAWERRGGWLENRICNCLRAELCCCFFINAPVIDHFIQTQCFSVGDPLSHLGEELLKMLMPGPTSDSQGLNPWACLYLTQITKWSSCTLWGESLWYRIQLSIMSLLTSFQLWAHLIPPLREEKKKYFTIAYSFIGYRSSTCTFL